MSMPTSLCLYSSDSDTQMETSALPGAEETSPAIGALGPLFKLTEVHLWIDCSVEPRSGVVSKPGKSIQKDNVGSSNSVTSYEFLPLPEDLELTRQMNDMGLPVSFQTNKEKKSAGRKRNVKKKNCYQHKEVDNDMLSSVGEIEEVDASLCPISMLGLSEQWDSDLKLMPDTLADNISNYELHYGLDYDGGLSKYLPKKDVEMEVGQRLDEECSSGRCLVDGSMVDGEKELDETQRAYACIEASLPGECGAEGEILCNDFSVELMHESEAAADLQCVELVESDAADSSNRGILGDWRVCWDDYYKRNYFYDITTKESRWEPPPGMHDIIFTNAADELPEPRIEALESIASFPDTGESDELGNSCVVDPYIDLTNKFGNDKGSSDLSFTDSSGSGLSSDAVFQITNGKMKKKKKTRSWKLYGKYSSANGILEEISPSISKYWWQRYQLFSRFDEGIQMDEEGWFSVTPEPIARHHASRCAGGTIVDCFTGVGGNAIQFAQRCQHVIAIDVDPRKIDYAQHNATVYGVEDLIDFVIGDCTLVAPTLKAETVFLSPPWGGPDYSKVNVFDINVMLQPYNGHFLYQVAKGIASKIVMFLPRNVDVNQLAELALSASPPWSLEVEKNFLNGKLKAITAYFTEHPA